MSKFYYFGILQWAIEETDLTRVELKILCKIANLPRGLEASQSWLAKELKTSRVTINKGLRRLGEYGLVEKLDDAYRLTGAHCKENFTPVKKTLQNCKENFTGDVKPALQKVLSKLNSTTSIYNTNIGSTESGDPHPQNTDFEKDNLYINTGKQPHPKYPKIWLSEPERKNLTKLYQDSFEPYGGFTASDAAYVYMRCEAIADATEGDTRRKHYNWLTGSIFKEVMQMKKQNLDLERSQAYLNGAKA